MAAAIQIAGLATIKIAHTLISSAALQTLGVTMDGVHITEHQSEMPVYTDEEGGPESGIPADIQDFGEYHIIRMVMTKYDETVMNYLRAGFTATSQTDGTAIAATAGARRIRGFLKNQGSATWRLLIHSPITPRNYLSAVIREPREMNKGTKHSQCVLVATCYDWSGTLFNATVT